MPPNSTPSSRIADLFPPTMHCVCTAPNGGLSLWMQWLGLLQPRTHWLFMCFILLNPRGFINIDWRQKMDGVQAQGIKSISLTSPRPHTTGLMLHKLLLMFFFLSSRHFSFKPFFPISYHVSLFYLWHFQLVFGGRCVDFIPSCCITSVISSGYIHITDKLRCLVFN